MTDQLPLSVQAELAEARANADRVRRLEAELRDAQDCASRCEAERDGFAAALVSEQEKRKQAEASIYSMTCTKQAFDDLQHRLRMCERERDDAIAETIETKKALSSTALDSFTELLGKLADVMTERDSLQAKLDGASKVIAEMAANRDRLQAEVEELRTMVIDGGEVVKTQRERIRVLTAEEAELRRQRDAALREVAILREAQRLVPRDLAPKHPACDCAKLPRVHPYDPRSCTAAGDESMLAEPVLVNPGRWAISETDQAGDESTRRDG